MKINYSKFGIYLTIATFLLSIAFGIYMGFFYKPSPDLNYEILTNTEVLSVKSEVQNLKLEYKDVDLIKEDKNISLVSFRIINTGSESITQDLYDRDKSFGFSVDSGKLISAPEVIESNKPSRFNDIIDTTIKNDVFLKYKIFDEDQYVTLKTLVLHENGQIPVIKPFGDIAKHDEITVSKIEDRTDKQTMDKVNNMLDIIIMSSASVLGILVLINFYVQKKGSHEELVERYRILYEDTKKMSEKLNMDKKKEEQNGQE